MNAISIIIICFFLTQSALHLCIIFNTPTTEDLGGTDVWIERTLSFDGDLDEELSFDAPSYCADISF